MRLTSYSPHLSSQIHQKSRASFGGVQTWRGEGPAWLEGDSFAASS